MKILILNASPKGKNSTTLQTALYLQALYPDHHFSVLHVGQQIKMFEKDFSSVHQALEQAELILFCYPVYTFIAPYQLHRLIELIKEDGIDLSGKFASQITTSKHFYDVTAHRFVEENCMDLGMKVVRGLSADMEDLLTNKGQQEARMYFEQLLFSCQHGMFVTPAVYPDKKEKHPYHAVLTPSPKTSDQDVVIVTNYAPEEESLIHMIEDFRAALPVKSRIVNLREFPFSGGCLGCFGCAVTGKCVYHDGFDEFLRTKIQTADAIVYAFAISDHYTHSSFKCYDDRQFCNGHRTVTQGTPVAYLISGNYQYEPNLQMIVEARSEVGGNYLCGVVTDEENVTENLTSLAQNLMFAMKKKLRRPANFYGVGGMKIFRDLIYLMQGMMKADHKFYKQHGIYDFPQKQKIKIFQMRLVGMLISIPSVQKKLKGKMTDYMIEPYRKVVEKAGKV
ncbi:MAG: NAD(P)H-dependent oxidoreductase [Candidatus Merdivicinus sp.]|jgi:multimeric flavodoxin WrbA